MEKSSQLHPKVVLRVLPHGLYPCSPNFPPYHAVWPRYTWNESGPGLLFCTILFPNHISGLFSQGQEMSLPGTKQQSGVDGGYPAESSVRCDKLMANVPRRCCQQTGWQLFHQRLALAAAHINVAWKLVSGITETMFTSSDFSWKVKHGRRGRGEGGQRPAVGEAQRIWVSKEALLLMIALKDGFHTTEGENPW